MCKYFRKYFRLVNMIFTASKIRLTKHLECQDRLGPNIFATLILPVFDDQRVNVITFSPSW